jgi:hypothetical protein
MSMSSVVQLALTAGPLACYFFILGLWRSGRSPRVVAGPLDFALLAFGVGGLVAFGPIGQWVVDRLFPAPSLWAWLAVVTALWLATLLWAPRTARRLVVYNVDPEAFDAALAETLRDLPGHFAPTLRGFEDPESGRGVAVERGARSGTATIEAYGSRPEPLIASLAPGLRARLQAPTPPRPGAGAGWFLLSALTLLIPLVGLVATRPQVRAALWALFQRLRGG